MLSFVDWMEHPDHGFYIREVWDDDKKAWIGPGKMRLRDFQRRIFLHCLTPDPETGKLPYETILYSTIKKSGKTALAAAIESWYAEQLPPDSYLYCIAGDEEQAGLVFGDITYHAKELGYKTLKQKIELPNDTTINVLSQSYKTIAGTRHALTVWDELWNYCASLSSKTLTADLRWVNVGEVKVGDRLVSFDEERNEKAYRGYKTGTVTAVRQFKAPALKVYLSSGASIVVTKPHKFLIRQGKHNEVVWMEAQHLNIGHRLMKALPVWDEDKSWDAAYLAGALDGEGSLSVNPQSLGYSMRFAQRDNEMLSQVLKSAKACNVPLHLVSVGGTNGDVRNFDFYDKNKLVETLGKIRPRRLLTKFIPENLGRMTADLWDTVTAIEEVEDDFAGITVDCGTYLTDGYCSHNTTEASRRAWDELTPIPTVPNSLRLVSTYAGFENESDLLWDLYLQGVGPEEHEKGQGHFIPELEDLPCWSNGRLFTYWDHEPRMPWQTDEYYEEQRKSLRPSAYIRLHTNSWTSSSEEFIPIEWWDRACTYFKRPADQDPEHPYRHSPITISVDAATKRDCTAISGWAHDSAIGKTIMVFHRIWTPERGVDFDLEATVESYILEKKKDFNIVSVIYDPRDLHQTMTRLRSMGLPCHELVQNQENMVRASQAFFDALKYDNVWAYPDDEWRKHIQMAIAENAGRGFRIVKDKGNRKSHVDGAISSAMGVYDAIQRSEVYSGDEVRVNSPFRDTSVWTREPEGMKLPWVFVE